MNYTTKNYILKEKIQGGFFQGSNAIAQDERISGMALAIYCYLSSLPSNFKANSSNIAKRFNLTLQTTWKYLKQLIDLGLIELQKARNTDGTFKDFYLFRLFSSISHTIKNIVVDKPPKMRAKIQAKPQKCATLSSSEFFDNKKEIKNKHEKISASAKIEKFSFKSKPKICKKSKIKKSLIICSQKFKNFTRLFTSALGNLHADDLNSKEKGALEKFFEYKNQKSKLTSATKRALLEQARELILKGQDLEKCVNQSIKRGYSELYEVQEYAFKPSLFKQKDKPIYNEDCPTRDPYAPYSQRELKAKYDYEEEMFEMAYNPYYKDKQTAEVDVEYEKYLKEFVY
ncbi:winged helix-turn-helix transcriptional regulator [Helicobacter cetorum]|uniref:winged helix-turn-helix transcriptional regulator n=1 Tax=Helicobacter cetorum TaxID=138563 RepID=UPI000CF184D4|nr:winged helix-turn-helix transcriptional regulator [Helicobacter cetorum]